VFHCTKFISFSTDNCVADELILDANAFEV